MSTAVSLVDERPFLIRALRFGLDQQILTAVDIERIKADGPKAIVQIANHFGTAYLRSELETAQTRLVNLASLYLEDFADGDLRTAAMSLRNNSFLSHSRGGSEMLKRLHAMPTDTSLIPRRADPIDEKSFVNERSFAFPMSLSAYRLEHQHRQDHQAHIDFSRWLAQQMNAKDDVETFSAEEVIHSAMLVLYVGSHPNELPSKSQFVAQVNALRKKIFKPNKTGLDGLLKNAPELFASLLHKSMADFQNQVLPILQKSTKTADQILHGEAHIGFFYRETPEEDVNAYDKLVAHEWVKITKGHADDPAVLATLFLSVATGQPPTASALLKDSKAIILAYRTQGFDSKAVLAFIEQHAPFEQQQHLKELWLEDLRHDAEVHLSDNDPTMPDSHMERALRWFKRNCACRWKGRLD